MIRSLNVSVIGYYAICMGQILNQKVTGSMCMPRQIPAVILGRFAIDKKQDCELAAAKRWLTAWGSHYSPRRITLLGDDLYCHQPFCEAAGKIMEWSPPFLNGIKSAKVGVFIIHRKRGDQYEHYYNRG